MKSSPDPLLVQNRKQEDESPCHQAPPNFSKVDSSIVIYLSFSFVVEVDGGDGRIVDEKASLSFARVVREVGM